MRGLLRRVWYLVHRRQWEADLAEELELHRSLKHDALRAQGLETDAAAFAARRALGNMLLAQDRARDVWISPWLQDVWRDLRLAARGFGREPAFTAVAVLVLGLGIGVNTTQFTIVNALCLRGLPITEPERVVYIGTRDARGRDGGMSYQDFRDLRAASRSLPDVSGVTELTTVVRDEDGAAERITAAYISTDGFHVLGQRPALGRAFRADDDLPGAASVVILGSDLWKGRYHADPSVLGRTIRVGEAPATVIGVMPDRFRFPFNADLWQPLSSMPGVHTHQRGTRTLGVIGRLVQGATVAEAHAEVESTASRLAREYPQTNAGIRPTLVPINERYNGRITDPAWLAFTIVGGLVVLIACANVANLLLMRSATRSHEIAVRASLGASRRRIVRQLLVESLTLGLLGGAVGLALSFAGVRLFARATPENGLPYWVTLTIDGRVLTCLIAVSLGSVIVFGLVPALQMSRTDMNRVLKAGRGTARSLPIRRWTGVFLTLEFALTVILVSAVVLGWRTGRAAARADSVLETTGLITTSITLPEEQYATADQRTAFYRQLREGLAGMTAISSASIVTALPFSGAQARQLVVDRQPLASGDTPPTVWALAVDEAYFQALRVGFRRGRAFTSLDETPGQEHVVVNQRLAEMYFSGADPIGRRIRLVSDPPAQMDARWFTIIGVAQNIRQRRFPEPDPLVYLPVWLDPPVTAALLVRSAQPLSSVGTLIRDQIQRLDENLPSDRVMTVEQFVFESSWNARVSSAILNTIAAIALLLAAVGLYAVTAYSVSTRTQEIGLRIALGANRLDIVSLVSRRVMVHVAIGFAAGVGCTLAWGKLLGGGIGRPDSLAHPATLSIVAVVLVIIGAVAALSPTHRAMRVDPVAALRQE